MLWLLPAGTIMLDLHGLHVSEGLKILSREISQLQSNSKGRVPVKVNILTGTGHHTKASAGQVALLTFLPEIAVRLGCQQWLQHVLRHACGR